MNIDRKIILSKARALYISTGKTKSITEALTWYLRDDAGPDEQIPLNVTTPELHCLRETLKTLRPTCEDCGSEMRLKIDVKDLTGRTWKTAWLCSRCERIEYSDQTPKKWLTVMQDETRKQNLSTPDKPNGSALST